MPDGDIMFRFVGKDAEDFQARATANVKKEQTPAERAQMLLDEAQELIEQARALQNGEDELAAATEKAKLAAAAAAKELAPKESVVEPASDGTVIMRRERKAPEGGDALGKGFEHVSKMGIKSIVDGIENMFDNFRRAVSRRSSRGCLRHRRARRGLTTRRSQRLVSTSRSILSGPTTFRHRVTTCPSKTRIQRRPARRRRLRRSMLNGQRRRRK